VTVNSDFSVSKSQSVNVKTSLLQLAIITCIVICEPIDYVISHLKNKNRKEKVHDEA